MKTLILTTALLLAGGLSAQTDSTKAETPQQTLSVGYSSSKGAGVRVGSADKDKHDGQDTIRLELKHKLLTILVTPLDTALQGDTLKDRIDELRTERRNLFTYWSGLDIGLNNWVGADGSTDLDKKDEFMQLEAGRSRFFAINFMEQKIEFGGHRAGLLTGLGLEFTSYHLENNVKLAYNSDSVFAIPVTDVTFSKNKLRQTGLRVPLMFEFNTKKAPLPTTAEEVRALAKAGGYSRKGNFHIAVGVVGSWYFDTMYKQKYRQYGDDQKDRSSGDLQLLPYRAAASVRIGWGGLNLFGEYALTPLFKDGKGPELTPFNVGLTIIGFN
ncbi:MAG: hypothetical protein IPN85_17535 [Flavobacteriales bacterium]|nr:hypothetical protein [Flavobacteriales bacterium]MBK9286744.1 hypothetical protein [Flavobacteriales bacterium]MBL0035231.1 hypothetical protein [Flavobacteriales bacterium]